MADHASDRWTVDGRGEVGTGQLPIRANGKIIAAIRDHGTLGDARLVIATPDLLRTAKAMMAKLENMTSDEFAKGGERTERLELAAAIKHATNPDR